MSLLRGQGGGLDFLDPTPSQPVGWCFPLPPGPKEGGGPRAQMSRSTPAHPLCHGLLLGLFVEPLFDLLVQGDFGLLLQIDL